MGLGPRGHLFALDRLTGTPRWQVDLVRAHDAAIPVYGFASSPLIVSDGDDGIDETPGRVVIQAGGAVLV